MEAYAKFTSDTNTLKILNNCRLYLQIITLTDITSADRKHLIKTQLNGSKSTSFTSDLAWPKQKRPNKNCWKIFKQVNQHIFCHKQSYILKKPLGKWKPTKFSQNTWNHFYDPSSKRLYQHHNHDISSWTFHRPINENEKTYNVSEGMPLTPPPNSLQNHIHLSY